MPVLFPASSVVPFASAVSPTNRAQMPTDSPVSAGRTPYSVAGLRADHFLRRLAGSGGAGGVSRFGSGRPIPPAVSVVIPVYRELENGNLFRLLEGFACQSSDTDRFELIFVVNNKPEIAGRRDNPVFVENQKTLLLLQYLAGDVGEIPKFTRSLPQWQRRIFRLTKARGIRCRVIDLSTEGIARVIGRIRDIGARDVLKRWGTDGIIAMLDADVTVGPDYVERILAYFSERDLGVLILNRDMRPQAEEGADALFYQTHSQERYSQVWQNNFIPSLPRALHGIEVGSPQIVARASALKTIGGVPQKRQGEDFDLSRLLCERFAYRFAPDIVVTVADRARVEGYDAGLRSLVLGHLRDDGGEIRAATLFNPRVTMMALALQALYRQSLLGRANEADLARIFHLFGFSFDRSRWNKSVERAESRWVNDWQLAIESLLVLFYFTNGESHALGPIKPPTDEDFFGFLQAFLSEDEFRWVRSQLEKERARHDERVKELRSILLKVLRNRARGRPLLTDIDDERVHEFFRSNPWIPQYLEGHKEELESIKRGLDFLAREFPDWLNPFDKTPVKKKAVQVGILARFLQEVRNRPKRFPQMYRLVCLLDGNLPAREFFEL